MNKQREELDLALEALQNEMRETISKLDPKEMVAIREALAEPEQKPVAWMYHGILHNGTPDRPRLIWRPEYMDALSASMGAKATPLYTAPPQRKPLTDNTLWEMWVESPSDVMRFARAIERAHGVGSD